MIPWDNLKKYFKKPVNSVLHIGGHLAEEINKYKDIPVVIWVEADADRCEKIKKIIPLNHKVICAVISDKESIVTFFEANNGMSSSVLELGTHLTAHPEVKYIDSKEVMSCTIDSLNLPSCDYVSLDIQGAELMALKGMTSFLKNVNYIYSEVNKEYLYKNGALVEEIDEFLKDFKRVETIWTKHGWGDAFYVRKSIL